MAVAVLLAHIIQIELLKVLEVQEDTAVTAVMEVTAVSLFITER